MEGPAVALRAGAARIDISPPIGVQLFGYPHARRISTGVHDPLWASALVLKSGGAQCALVALDLLFLDPPTARRIRRRVAAALGVEDSAVFISCSHTHSGPVTSFLAGWAGDIAMPAPDPEFLERVSEAVVHSACEASSSMRPASLAWTAARVEGVGCNRCDPTGPSDPEVGTLAVRGQEGGIISIVMVYGMHPTVLHEDCTLVSSDFPHYARIELEERFGGSMVALYHTGPAGDQSPRYHVKSQTFAEAERLGRRLGAAVANAVAAIPPGSYRSEPLIECRLAAFDPVRRRLPEPAEAERMLAEYSSALHRLRLAGADRAAVRTAECAVFGAEAAVHLARAAKSGTLDRLLNEYAPFEIQAIRIGDCALAGLPAEVFCEYGLRIRQAAGGRAFAVSLANGHMQGYITTAEASKKGGYEAAGAVFDWRTGDVMVETAGALLESLFSPKGRSDAQTGHDSGS